MYETDFTFGRKLCEPLNTYFATHIADILDDLVCVALDDEVYSENCLDCVDFFKQELVKYAYAYLEKEHRDLIRPTFDILFSEDEELVKVAQNAFESLLELKKGMINFS